MIAKAIILHLVDNACLLEAFHQQSQFGIGQDAKII